MAASSLPSMLFDKIPDSIRLQEPVGIPDYVRQWAVRKVCQVATGENRMFNLAVLTPMPASPSIRRLECQIHTPELFFRLLDMTRPSAAMVTWPKDLRNVLEPHTPQLSNLVLDATQCYLGRRTPPYTWDLPLPGLSQSAPSNLTFLSITGGTIPWKALLRVLQGNRFLQGIKIAIVGKEQNEAPESEPPEDKVCTAVPLSYLSGLYLGHVTAYYADKILSGISYPANAIVELNLGATLRHWSLSSLQPNFQRSTEAQITYFLDREENLETTRYTLTLQALGTHTKVNWTEECLLTKQDTVEDLEAFFGAISIDLGPRSLASVWSLTLNLSYPRPTVEGGLSKILAPFSALQLVQLSILPPRAERSPRIILPGASFTRHGKRRVLVGNCRTLERAQAVYDAFDHVHY
ncbi:hypothetical protein C8Q77DRAFT_1075193 [Trametes polyzona]|nr:hypothetical protein C8Q77DRAFT_1075193 [Trametes polyzona]